MGLALELNLTAMFELCQLAVADMRKTGYGKIINIASMLAFFGGTHSFAYAASKGGVVQLTKALSNEVAGEGICVNAIAPGFFVTKQNEKMLFHDDGTPTPRTGKILAATPMGRFGRAEELDGALLFLLSEEAASFITGVVLPIDGGFSAYSGV